MQLPYKYTFHSKGKLNEDERKLQQQIWQSNFKHATSDKETIGKVAKLELNKITPDNFDNLKYKISNLYTNPKNTEDDKNLFVQVFFQKACHEEKYRDLYITLIKIICTDIVKSQNHGKVPSDFKYMKSNFVDRLWDECKRSFEKLFEGYSIDHLKTEDDIMDYETKHKKKVYGNLNFIALLIKNKMINRKISFYVLNKILENAKSTNKNEGQRKLNIYEGACKFL